MPLKPVGPIRECDLAGRKFHRLDVKGGVSGTDIHQAYYATISQGYALGCVITEGVEPEVLPPLLKTLRFAAR